MELTPESFGILAVCAIRYCHGRQTYMPGLVMDTIKPYLSEITDKDLQVMINDCDYQESFNLYGDETIDKPGWLKWKQVLLDEQERRKMIQNDE